MGILRILGKLIFKRYYKLVSTLFLILYVSLLYIFACGSIFLSIFDLCYDLLTIWGVYKGYFEFEFIPFIHIYTLIVAFILKHHCNNFLADLKFDHYYPEVEKLSLTRDSFEYTVYVILDDYLLNHGYELHQRIMKVYQGFMMVYLAIWGLLFFYFASEFFFDFLESLFDDPNIIILIFFLVIVFILL